MWTFTVILPAGVTTANIFARQREFHWRADRRHQTALGPVGSELPFEGALPGIKFALGENPKRSNFSIPGSPNAIGTRMGVEETIRRAFAEARDY